MAQAFSATVRLALNLVSYVAEIRLSGALSMSEVPVPAPIEGFALRDGYRAERTDQDEAYFIYDLFQGADARRVARFLVRIGTTDEGFADLLANEVDIALALREIRPAEIQRAYDAALGDMIGRRRSLVLSLDAMVPVVAPDNPIIEISPTDLARFFAGQISNWAALGGPDAPIALHLPSLGSGLSQTVDDKLMAPAGLVVTPDILRHRITNQIVAAVARNPFAIGLVTTHAETGMARPVALTSGCGYALRANRRTIETEGYPLTAPMFFLHAGAPISAARPAFLTYARGPAAQIVIRRAGFVDPAPEMIAIGDQGIV